MSLSAPAAAAPPLVPVSVLMALGVSAANAQAWSPALSAACSSHAINTRLRLAAFIANIVHETGRFTALTECLNYSPAALLSQWPTHFTAAQAYAWGRTAQHPANPHEIAEHAYGGRMGNRPVGSGDGDAFKGAGPIETTGRGNYTDLAKAMGWTKPLTDLPAYIQTPEGGSLSAVIYWTQHRINVPADRGDIEAVRLAVNGGDTGLDEVEALYSKLMRLLPAT